MRCDGNVSLRRRGEEGFGTKTELKNLNSFKSLHDALAFEICRQAEVLGAGGVVRQETRHWEPTSKRTVVMRVKETNDDYRFFPDPDLAPFDLSDAFVDECRTRMPELPDARRDRYVETLGLRRRDATIIASEPVTSALFEEAVAGAGVALAGMVANVVVNLLPGHARVAPSQTASLAALLADDAITFAQAREVLDAVDGTDDDPAAVVDARGMRQMTDEAALGVIVDAVLARCGEQVAQYRAGKTQVIGYLVGQCMKASAGSGNPKLFRQLLADRLG